MGPYLNIPDPSFFFAISFYACLLPSRPNLLSQISHLLLVAILLPSTRGYAFIMPTGVVPLAPTSIPKLPQIQDMVKWTGDWRHDNIANPNVNREDVNREKCAKDVAFQVEKQFKTFKAKNPRINEVR